MTHRLAVWLIVLSPLLAFTTYLLGFHFPPVLLLGLFGLPVTLVAGYMLGRAADHLATYWISVLVLGLGIAALPFALFMLETSTGILLKDPAGKFMAIGFVVTVPLGAVLSLVATVGLTSAVVSRRVARSDTQQGAPGNDLLGTILITILAGLSVAGLGYLFGWVG